MNSLAPTRFRFAGWLRRECVAPSGRTRPSTWWAAPLLLMAGLAVFLGAGSSRPLEEHEVFVARTATEMQRSGDWIVPRFDGATRLGKPPLSYWAAIAAHRLLGGTRSEAIGERAARLPSALAALALIAVTYALAKSVTGDHRAGLAAAGAWASSLGFYEYARSARPEMLYALACSLAVLGFVRIAARRGSAERNAWLAWGGIALALLAKGPLVPAFLLAGLALAVLTRRRPAPGSRLAVVLRPWPAAALIGLAALYFVAVASRVPGAWSLWHHEMFDRTRIASGNPGEVLTLPYLWKAPPLLGTWLLLLPVAAIYAVRSKALPVRMLVVAVAVTLLLLGLSRRTHVYYALPVMPLACAVVGAAAVGVRDRWKEGARWASCLRVVATATGLAGACVAALAIAGWPREAPPTAACFAAALGLLAVSIAAAAWVSARDPVRGPAWLAASFAAVLAASGASNLGAESERFTKAEFARQVGRHVPAQIPLARLSGSLELVVQYADRNVEDVDQRYLAHWISFHPDGIVLARRSDLADGILAGDVLLEEAAPPGRDPMVLVAPSRATVP